mmetsp:Transcript_2024/g.4879  ORF Transcript_2024/g.4879 Transcript_2024/m.4879 type:complete len:572 (+) Transcript_2024:63-1778(+)
MEQRARVAARVRNRHHPASRSLCAVLPGFGVALILASTSGFPSLLQIQLALPTSRLPAANKKPALEVRRSPARSGRAASGSDGTGSVSAAHVTDARFESLPVSDITKKAISDGFGYEYMTEVQAQTVGPILDGADILARAKTGTGKTLGFLIPTVEALVRRPPRDPTDIQALIISPTRELASQIDKEANLLLSFHTGLRAVSVVGGIDIKRDHRTLRKGPCSVLIATPGRLQDHLSNTPGFASRLENVQVFILDEADQLLDMGFRQSIVDIVKYLPPASHRQGLLFSATFPTEVSQIAGFVLSSGYKMINTVKPQDESTPDQITQGYAIVPTEEITSLLWQSLQRAREQDPDNFKIIVFFTTARLVGYYAEVFRRYVGRELFELHSRKSQSFRTKESARFRAAPTGMLFSSDVSARGLDYPGVTTVIQVGVPSSKDQYIHRLGRTGRAGRPGVGLLILHDFESYFPETLRDLPLQQLDPGALTSKQQVPPDLSRAVDIKVMAQAYSAWLGYYRGKQKDMRKNSAEVVQEANRFARSIGAIGQDGLPPPITKKTVGKMGLKGVHGLNVVQGV